MIAGALRGTKDSILEAVEAFRDLDAAHRGTAG
jgi:hypothetical protein